MPAHVLIADDDPGMLLSLESLMKKQGYQVLIARDGGEAFELLQQHRPRVVLLDIRTPHMNGYELCAYVRKTAGFEQTKVIFLTATRKAVEGPRGYGTGADLCLPKPISSRELAARIRELLAPNPAPPGG